MIRQLGFALLLLFGFVLNPIAIASAQQVAGEADIFAPVISQDTAAPAQEQAAPAVQKPAKKTKLAAAATKPAKADAGPASGGDTDQRLQQLEEQIADMQVVVGTMESTGKVRAAGAAPVAGNSDADVRVGRLEAQMQGLNAQMTELANEMRALDARLQGGAATQLRTQPAAPRQTSALAVAPLKQAAIAEAPSEQPAAAGAAPGGFDDPANGVAESMTVDALPQPKQPAPQVAALTAPTNDPQTAYDLAYGLVLQQDYAGAEGAFRDYIGRFPQSPLASNAHYWLGQSFFARGQYKPAADAFLRGYKTYRTGQKAPDSLLKVAMSLSRLGQKDSACSAFTALDGEFPNAPAQVKHLAQAERERTGC